jgi:hypothetical protein
VKFGELSRVNILLSQLIQALRKPENRRASRILAGAFNLHHHHFPEISKRQEDSPQNAVILQTLKAL